MPHVWPFGAPSTVSRPTCATTTDPPRLLTDVIGAFVDRTPIDWRGLAPRLRAGSDRALIEQLEALEAIRRHSTPGSSDNRQRRTAIWSARLVAILAALQTAAGFVAVFESGLPLGERSLQLTLAVAFAAASLCLAVTASRDPRRLFLLATFLCTASTFTLGALRPLDLAVPLARWSVGPLEVFIPACLWQFALDFPRVRRFTPFDRWARGAAAAAWLCGVAALVLHIVVAYGVMDAAPVASLLPNKDGRVFWHAFTLSIVPAVCAIFLRSRRAPYHERIKVARFAMALVAGGAPFLLMGFTRAVVPSFDRWLWTSSPAERVWVDGLVVAGLIAAPLLSTIAVIVDRPFELHTRLWRRYRLPSMLRLRDDRLARAIANMRLASGPRETIAVFERDVRGIVGATTARVMTPRGDGGFADPSSHLTAIPRGAALLAVAGEAPASTIDVSTNGLLFELLPSDDREWITVNDIDMVVTIRRRSDEIVALAAIGPKRGGRAYEREDHALVAALAGTAGLTWDADRVAIARGIPEQPASEPEHPANEPEQPAYECPTCGVVEDARHLPCACGGEPAIAALPHRLGSKFLIERRLGRGGMGVVYLARDLAIGRLVALKTLPGLRPGGAARLRGEARAMNALRHDGLATLYGLESWRECPVLVVEYFPRGTLAQRLTHGALTSAETRDLGIALARTLAYMHGEGVMHGDLKPSNIAFAASGAPVLLDFGLAILLEPGVDDPVVAGTSAYLPPETLRGAPASPAVDLWSLAMVLLEAVSGTGPATGDERDALLARGLDADLANVLRRALESAPDRRFHTGLELEAALKRIGV